MPDSPRLRAAAPRRFVTHQLMPSLRQLLTAHTPLLVLDAASTRVHAGWLERDAPARWAMCEDEAGVGVFQTLAKLEAQPADAAAFVYCDGPGSILGIRTVAMALRSWCVLRTRPVFAYHSLTVVAHALGDPGLTIIADARRDSWHCVSIEAPLRRIPTSQLAGKLAMPDGFRTWTTLPPDVARVGYVPAELLPAVQDVELFRPTTAPDAFLHEEPSYATWTPAIHRAP